MMRTGPDVGTRYAEAQGRRRQRRQQSTKPINGELPDIAIFRGLDEEAEIERLAKLPRLQYERERETAAKKLQIKRLAALDAEVAAKRKAFGLGADDVAGDAVIFEEPEPWDKPVDGAALLDELVNQQHRFVILPKHGPEIGALWITHSYCLDAFDISPRLEVKSPTKGCGKSVYFDFLEEIVYRPDPAGNITVSAFFRSVHKDRPCVLIDDFDSFVRQDSDIRNVLNTGHHIRGRVKRTIAVGDGHEVRVFRTHCAVAYNHIGDLPPEFDTLTDRCLAKRKKTDPKIKRLYGPRRRNAFADLRRQLARWSLDHMQELIAAMDKDDDDDEELFNRIGDNWRPLFAIARAVGGDWPQKAREAALASVKDREKDNDDGSLLEMLLHDMRGVFNDKPNKKVGEDQHGDPIFAPIVAVEKDLSGCERHFVGSEDLVAELLDHEDRPWPEMGRDRKPLTTTRLARLLRPLKVRPSHNAAKTDRGYYLEALEDHFERYLSPISPFQPVQPVQPEDKKAEFRFSNPSGNPSAGRVGNREDAYHFNDLDGLDMLKGGKPEMHRLDGSMRSRRGCKRSAIGTTTIRSRTPKCWRRCASD